MIESHWIQNPVALQEAARQMIEAAQKDEGHWPPSYVAAATTAETALATFMVMLLLQQGLKVNLILPENLFLPRPERFMASGPLPSNGLVIVVQIVPDATTFIPLIDTLMGWGGSQFVLVALSSHPVLKGYQHEGVIIPIKSL